METFRRAKQLSIAARPMSGQESADKTSISGRGGILAAERTMRQYACIDCCSLASREGKQLSKPLASIIFSGDVA